MLLATKIMAIKQQLEAARLSFRQGRVTLAQLQHLDTQVTLLLDEAKGTHFEPSLVCIRGLVRSLETRASQQLRQARDQAREHTRDQVRPQVIPNRAVA